jgi:hypothetical protein
LRDDEELLHLLGRLQKDKDGYCWVCLSMQAVTPPESTHTIALDQWNQLGGIRAMGPKGWIVIVDL